MSDQRPSTQGVTNDVLPVLGLRWVGVVDHPSLDFAGRVIVGYLVLTIGNADVLAVPTQYVPPRPINSPENIAELLGVLLGPGLMMTTGGVGSASSSLDPVRTIEERT